MGIKGWLYRWLRGHVTDSQVMEYLQGQGRLSESEARALVASWKVTRTGADIREIVVELWKSAAGELLLSRAFLPFEGDGQAWKLPPRRRADFFGDALALAAGHALDLAPAGVNPWKDGSCERLADWTADEGGRLLNEGELDVTTCRYLGIAFPVRWFTTAEAAPQLQRSQSQVAWWARHDRVPARKNGLDYEIDPLWVAWRRAHPPRSRRPHASYERVLELLAAGGSISWSAGARRADLAFPHTSSDTATHVRVSTLEEMEAAGLVRLERVGSPETITTAHLPTKEEAHA